MNSTNNRNNHNFQIAYFIAGSCHTADGAWSLLQDLKEKQDLIINNFTVAKHREKAKKLKAEIIVSSAYTEEADKLLAEADLMEIENNLATVEKAYLAAVAERNFIEDCIAKVNSFRKYKHLEDADAHEAIQQEEWKLEFKKRLENYMLSVGTIPHDLLTAIRMHPDFISELNPYHNHLASLRATAMSPDKNIAQAAATKLNEIAAKPNYVIPGLEHLLPMIEPDPEYQNRIANLADYPEPPVPIKPISNVISIGSKITEN